MPKAYVVLAAGVEPTTATAHDILLYARTHLSAYQRIRRIEVFDLPKTISGKIRRVELRQREERIARGEESAASGATMRSATPRSRAKQNRYCGELLALAAATGSEPPIAGPEMDARLAVRETS